MPDTPTPGQCAYEAYWRAFKATFGTHGDDTWETIHPGTQRAWEAAAQVVLEETRRRALAAIRHWYEFGPEYGFAEAVDTLERWLVVPEEPPLTLDLDPDILREEDRHA